MEKFNFDAPINATVIFDDSSDSEKEIEIDTQKETKIHISEIEIETKKESSNKLHELENRRKNIENNLWTTKSELEELKKHMRRLSDTTTLTSTTIKEKCTEENTRCTQNLNLSLSKGKKSRKEKQKLLDMPSLEDDDNTLQNINVPSEFDNLRENHNSDQRNKKRKKLINIEKISKRRSTKNSLLKAVNVTTIHDTDKGESETNNNTVQCNSQIVAEHSTNNSLLLTPDINTNGKGTAPLNETHKELEQSNMYSSETLKNFYRHNQQQSRTTSNQPNADARTCSLNEINYSISNFLIDSLNTVSEHIINILISYLSYVRIYKDVNSDPHVIENAKKCFIRTKNHFFDLSYSTVVNIIIPRNAIDNIFVLNFIENTRKMAILKFLPFSRTDIERLYHEMIAWVEKRQEQIQKMKPNQMHHPLLARELQKPTNPPTYLNPHWETYTLLLAYKEKHDSSFAAHSSQNLTAQSVNNKQLLYGQPRQPNSRPMNIPPPPYSDKRINDSKHSSNRNCTHTSQLPRSNMQYDAAYYNRQAGYPQAYDLISESPQNRNNNQNQLYEKQIDLFNFLYTQNDSVNTAQLSAFQLNSDAAPKLPPSNIHSCQNQRLHLQTLSQSSQNSISPTPNFLPIHQDMDLRQYNQHFRAENFSQAEQSRSISRDSGFISPLYFNSNNDQPVNLQCNSREGSSQTSATPLITHVTSLNPNVSYIVDGPCTVCGKTTKQKCIGCYKCYYCSHDCQNSDWKNHQIVCKIISR